ncbi:MAG TPA: aminopeptidase P family N-terminal domain-containing protein [Micropepsaceae bacterium]|nr:aminopeptidase P family N-terminal domain-containing protein [Micropepsaceae bacterium]
MRRGLINWDPHELPLSVLEARTQRLRNAMAAADCDAIILYTNFIRCAAVAWMTGFSPYWADGILVVPREGEMLFATTLSKRMGSWIQTVMPNARVVTSPNPGQLAGNQLQQLGTRRIGILELGDLPGTLYSDLAAALPGAEIVDASAIFPNARYPADEAEHKLLGRSDQIAADALRNLDRAAANTAGEAVAMVEKAARMDGAEEIYVAVAADLDSSRAFLRLSGKASLGRRFAVRATVAYKGSWVRRIASFSRDRSELAALHEMDSEFSRWLTELPFTSMAGEIAQRVTKITGANLENWFAEAPLGTRPLNLVQPNDAHPVPPIVLTMNLTTVGGLPWCGAALMPRRPES